jgi:hypothetical protein
MTHLPFFTELLKKHVLSFVEGAAAPAPERLRAGRSPLGVLTYSGSSDIRMGKKYS